MRFIVSFTRVGDIDPVAFRKTLLTLLTTTHAGGGLMKATDSGNITDIHVAAPKR
jgi:hypothetical protein